MFKIQVREMSVQQSHPLIWIGERLRVVRLANAVVV